MAIKILKSKTIEERKPHLKKCPNHFHLISQAPTRIYPSWQLGPAKRDDRGWYK